MIITLKIIFFNIIIFFLTIELFSQDWKQFQNNSEHHGRVDISIQPPYRVRWIWVGENLTLRNKNSNPQWTDDLTSREGFNFPLPSSTNFTISGNAQAIIKDSLVFVGTMEGNAYFIKLFDGSTYRKISLNAPIVSSAAVEENVAVFATLYGDVYGIKIPEGHVRWKYSFPKVITIAPVINNGRVFCADHSGRTAAINLQTGEVLWTLELKYPIQSTPAANDSYLIVCSEDMNVNVIDAKNGVKLKTRRVQGQSFRDTHPVILDDKVYVTAVPAPMFGSEWMMEEVMAASSSFEDEEQKILDWLNGSSSIKYSSKDWRNKYVFIIPTLEEPFKIASGPNDGCGSPPPSMVVDNQNRVLGWFKTKFPTLTNPRVGFGSAYGLDIMSINKINGKRERINLGKFAGMWMLESDNLYALSISGNQIWMRQNFRGTQMIDLTNANHFYVQAEARQRDGGIFNEANIIYFETENFIPKTTQTEWQGRVAPSFSGGYIFIVEHYALVCIERNY